MLLDLKGELDLGELNQSSLVSFDQTLSFPPKLLLSMMLSILLSRGEFVIYLHVFLFATMPAVLSDEHVTLLDKLRG